MPTSKLGKINGVACGVRNLREVSNFSAARVSPTTAKWGLSLRATFGRVSKPASMVSESVPTISTDGSRLRKNRSREFSTFHGKCSNITHRATEWLRQPSFLDLKRQGFITK